MAELRELKIPASVEMEGSGFELLRFWIAGGRQHIALTTTWEDPAAWGLAIADVARHVARAYEYGGTHARGAALARIMQALNAELESPTDAPTGGLVD